MAEDLELRIEDQEIGGIVLRGCGCGVVVVAHLTIGSVEIVPSCVGHLPIVPEVVAILGLRLGGDKIARAVEAIASQKVVVVLESRSIEAGNRHIDASVSIGIDEPPTVVDFGDMVETCGICTEVGTRTCAGIIGGGIRNGSVAIERGDERDVVTAPPSAVSGFRIQGSGRQCACHHQDCT